MNLLERRIEDLVAAHGLPCSQRRLLEPRHGLDEFTLEDDLFHRFARVVCRANKIPRKELFEAWAMALFVHQHFPETQRFADLACGHGMVSWALLVLYHESGRQVSAVCIDINMPLAAERLQKAMLEEWPQLSGRWHYVQGSVDGIIPSPDTLLVGVHACASLSDIIIANAIYGNSPLALVPCCHSKKSLTESQATQFGEKFLNLADYVDGLRMTTLEMAGFKVQQARINEAITPKNGILLATPSSKDASPPTTRLETDSRLRLCTIPLQDTPEAKAGIVGLSGKEAGEQRKQVFKKKSCFGLVVWLPPNQDISAQQVEQVATTNDIGVIQVTCVKELPHHDAVTNTYIRTYQVVYPDLAKKHDAIEKHVELCHTIPNAFPGARVQQLPKLRTILELIFCLPVNPSSNRPYMDVTSDDVAQAISTILLEQASPTRIDVKFFGRNPYRRRNGRYTRTVRIHYQDITKKVAENLHEKVRSELPNVLEGILVL
jgi:hypothetical protein